MQRPLDPGPVVPAKDAHPVEHIVQVVLGHLVVAQDDLALAEAGLGEPADIHDHLQQVAQVARLAQRFGQAGRQGRQQGLQVIGDLFLHDRQVGQFPLFNRTSFSLFYRRRHI